MTDGSLKIHPSGAYLMCQSGALSLDCCEDRAANIWSVTPGTAVNWWRKTVEPAFNGALPRTLRVHVDGSSRVLVAGNRGELGHTPGNLLMYDAAGTLLWSELDELLDYTPCSIDPSGNVYHRSRSGAELTAQAAVNGATVLTSRDAAGAVRWTYSGFPALLDAFYDPASDRVYTLNGSPLLVSNAGDPLQHSGGALIRWNAAGSGTFVSQSSSSSLILNPISVEGGQVLIPTRASGSGGARVYSATTGLYLGESTLGPSPSPQSFMLHREDGVWYRTARTTANELIVSAHAESNPTGELWRTQIGYDDSGFTFPRLVLHDGSVYAASARWTGASVWKLDAATGAVQWSYDTGDDAYDVAVAGGNVLIVGALSDSWSETP